MGVQGTGTGQPTQHPRQVFLPPSPHYQVCALLYLHSEFFKRMLSSCAPHISYFLASSNLNLFICPREWCNGCIALQVFTRGPSSKADVRGGYTTPRPTLFMLVTPQKHPPTLHHLPFHDLINKKHVCLSCQKYFYFSICNLYPKMFSYFS